MSGHPIVELARARAASEAERIDRELLALRVQAAAALVEAYARNPQDGAVTPATAIDAAGFLDAVAAGKAAP